MMTTPKRYSWTQPCCAWCFEERNPGRQPTVLKDEYREREICVHCGKPTGEGIYVRTDPKTAAHPTNLKS